MNNMGVHLKEGTESELQKGRRCNQHLKKCGRQHLLGTGCASLRFRMSYESTDNHIALEVLPNACAVCGACDATLLTCTRCEVVRYCGREHQKAHFQTHVAFCKSVRTVREEVKGCEDEVIASPVVTWLALSRRRSMVCDRVSAHLCRPLTPAERLAIMLARCCWVCFGEGKGVKLEACSLCRHAFHCDACGAVFDSEVHPRKGKHCTDIAVAVAVNQLPLPLLPDGTRLPLVYVPPNVCAEYVAVDVDAAPPPAPLPPSPLPSTVTGQEGLSGWEDEERDAGPDPALTKPVRSVSGTAWPSFVGRHQWPSFPPVVMTAMVSPLSHPLTIALVWERLAAASCLSSPAVSSCPNLTVHILGSRMIPELFSLTRYELLLHLFPSLSCVSLRFFGPELGPPVAGSSPAQLLPGGLDTRLSSGTDLLCPKCASASRRVRVGMSCGHYHAFLERRVVMDTPDIVILFNPDFQVDKDEWQAALRSIGSKVPVVVTSPTLEDANSDISFVTAASAGFTLLEGYPCANPYRATIPHLIPETPFHCGFVNYYVSVFTTK